MSSTIGGNDPDHDLSDAEKNRREPELRKQAREAMKKKQKKVRDKLLARANEISRAKSKRADHH